ARPRTTVSSSAGTSCVAESRSATSSASSLMPYSPPSGARRPPPVGRTVRRTGGSCLWSLIPIPRLRYRQHAGGPLGGSAGEGGPPIEGDPPTEPKERASEYRSRYQR